MNLEFRPTVKSINIASEELTKITLEVKNNSLDGKYDQLKKFSNKVVNIIIVPEYYTYSQQFDRSTNQPIQEWIINPDGTAEIRKTEQTQLELDDQGNIDIEERPVNVDKDIIDEFIMKAKSIEVPGHITINPRDAIMRLREGEDFGEIADDFEMSDVALLNELEKSRQYFAPFADAWNKNKDEIDLEAGADEENENDDDTSESGDDPY